MLVFHVIWWQVGAAVAFLLSVYFVVLFIRLATVYLTRTTYRNHGRNTSSSTSYTPSTH